MTAQVPSGKLAVGTITENWSGDARFYEYSTAADPIGSGIITPVPIKEFGAQLYNGGDTRVIPLDLSAELKTPYPATSPSLLAQFVRINQGDSIETSPNATSELYYVISGAGRTVASGKTIGWAKGDFLTLPAGCISRHTADEDATLYYIVDSPLLNYLGVRATEARFQPTRFSAQQCDAKLQEVAKEPDADKKIEFPSS
ncbi:hypothetical protein [Alicyclobacillus fastidiosus]|uniref:hypothetical protein n=1 Tax=Alicyclobacillus fastidiosus TaxID=392011 RepID=UPI0023E95F29|nr:hypothetical protein [Alicyclobacillus fastidiosus]GMA65160.1 hypothetical protein GCM10025859_56000 [Alicyclobacillus fastidiosus]